MMLVVAAKAVLVTAAAASEDCTRVLVTMSTPGPCVDSADFGVDPVGFTCDFYATSGFVSNGCWVDLLSSGWSELPAFASQRRNRL